MWRPSLLPAGFAESVSGDPAGKHVPAPRRFRVDQHPDDHSAPVPKDARESTEEQREVEEQLEHAGDDPDAPGAQQSADQLADESRR